MTVTGASGPNLVDLDPADVVAEHRARGLDQLSDARLGALVAASIARPKVAAADSFVLHAPLELLARTALLPLVHPAERERARQRIVWLGATYEAAGESVGPVTPLDLDGPVDGVERLTHAVRAGDVDGADAAASWLAAAATPTDLYEVLAGEVLPRLSAAAHGNIFLYLLPRVAPRDTGAAGMLRGLARELARNPDWGLTWHLDLPASPEDGSGADELVERLRRPESPGDAGSNFIFPTMDLVERSGLAADLLADPAASLSIREATSALLRTAAWSMLQDDPAHAPYGWSHCLTLPQAALGLAGHGVGTRDAVAIAATHVLGFRATQGRVTLDPGWAPEAPAAGTDLLDALEGTPADASAAVWHAPDDLVPTIVGRLATRAAVHHDAHLAKYTLACLDATSADPGAGRLYLAAAAFLGAWWAQLGPTDDPLER